VAIRVLFLTACALAALVPFFSGVGGAEPASGASFPGWPTTLDGRTLRPRPLAERELHFARGLPGRMARFTDGRGELTLRWVTRPTRRLHPAADCYRGLGYRVRPLPSSVDAKGRTWGRFEARRDARVLVVRERIEDARGQGFADVSAWYWSAVLGRTTGPWWAYTIAEATGPSTTP